MNDDKPEEQDLEAPRASERVFDISSDLNIKELKEEIARETPPPALKIFSMMRPATDQKTPPAPPTKPLSVPVPTSTTSIKPTPTPVPRPPINTMGNYRPIPSAAAKPIPAPTTMAATTSATVPRTPPEIRPLETGSNLPKSPSVLQPVNTPSPISPTRTVPFVPKAIPRTILPTAPTGMPAAPRSVPAPTPAPIPKAPPAVTVTPIIAAVPIAPTAPSAMQSELASILPKIVSAQKIPAVPVAASAPVTTPPKPLYTTSVISEPPGLASNILKKLRTYEGDVAEVLSHRGTSALNMTIAENKRKQGEERIGNKEETSEESSHSLRKALVIVFSFILIAAGAGGGYYLYSRSPLGTANQPAPDTQKPKAPVSLVPSDAQTTISISGLNAQTLLTKIGSEIAKPQNPDSIKEIILMETNEATQTRAAVTTMTGLLGIPVPDIILRTISPRWMLGVYANQSGSHSVFVVVKTDLFQNAFAGMLKWEGFMGLSLSRITSTIEERGQFKDEIVKNKDVRVYVGESGRTDFVYSFIDNSTLVWAQDDGAVAEVITRLENSPFVR